MRAIICGAGQVGYSIAAYLSREENDITVIDHDPATIARVNEELDVNGIVGHASSPDVLFAAGAKEADMIIAVTHHDEVNMIACQVAHSLFSIPKKIARIRDRRYTAPAWANLFSRSHMPIDVIISPEVEIASAIAKRLSVPGTTNVIPMAEGKLYLCGVLCEETCPVLYTPLRQLTELFPTMNLNVVAVSRGGKTIVPDAEFQMQVGDEVFFIVDAAQLDRALVGFGHEEQKARSIVILGGGNIGHSLTQELLAKQPYLRIKMIENNRERAVKLSEDFDNIIVLHGDGLDRNIMEEADMPSVETLIALTNDDETNILGSLLAKQYGCDRTITLLNKGTYNTLLGPLGLGAIISPRAITVSTIMQYVRRGRIRGVHNILDGQAEVIEAEISETSGLINTPIKDIDFPHDVIVGAIVRDEQIIMPRPDTQMKPGDHLVVLAGRGESRKVEKMLSVSVDLF
jgi:trk system potassium uptake protein TrkA